MNAYRANAFAPDTGTRTFSGTIQIESGFVLFTAGEMTGRLPLQNAVIRRGGHNGEQIFFEHPEFPGWSIYCSDPALLTDPELSKDERFKALAKKVSLSRKAIPLPVVFLLAFFSVILLGIVLLWTQKDRIVDFIVDRIPVEWEVKFGDQAFEQFARGGTLLTNTPWREHVDAIAARLVPAVQPNPYELRFHIMQDTNVNAFALPGGNMVILTGLLEEAESAEEVAGVLAHEIAHVTRRHSLRNIVKSAGLIVVIQAVLGDLSGVAALAIEASRFLVQQKFSRDFEREADDAGWQYLIAARIDPRGMSQFFEKMKAVVARSGGAAMEGSLALLNTHPASQERIDRLEEKRKALGPGHTFQPLPAWKMAP